MPMISDEELGAIVANIRELGLIYPITIDKAGAVVDGKIRLMACKIAGVEPRFEVLPEDKDPFDFSMSMNICRQHRTPTQRALATARELLECPEGSTPPTVINRALVETAVFVLHHAPGRFNWIDHGAISLDTRRKVAEDLEAGIARPKNVRAAG